MSIYAIHKNSAGIIREVEAIDHDPSMFVLESWNDIHGALTVIAEVSKGQLHAFGHFPCFATGVYDLFS